MRSVLIAASLAATLVLTGCGISSSSSAPLQPAPTPGPAEQPTTVLQVGANKAAQPLTLRVFDRSFAVTNARSATAAELANIEPLDGNEVGLYHAEGREVMVTWAGIACPQSGDLFIGPGVSEIVIAPSAAAECPAGANVRGVVLEFKLEIDLKAISVDVRPRANA
jgi:hypothetical protein